VTLCVTVTWWWLLWVPLGAVALLVAFSLACLFFFPWGR
jgi:hypothetical protein